MHMLYSYDQCLNKHRTDYQIKKQISAGNLYKVGAGIYSDEKYVPEIAVIRFKYPLWILSMNSAFYYHGLTDTIPTKCYLTTDKDSSKIKDNRVKQSFENSDYLELVRDKNKIPFDYYKEIISSYRKIINKLDIQAVQEYAKLLPKTNKVIDTLELEVF